MIVRRITIPAILVLIPLLSLASALLLFLSRPERVSITRGSIRMKEVSLDRERVIVLEGDPPNRLGQVQGLGLRREGRTIYLEQYVIRWHPFAELSTHRDWPAIVKADELPPGEYAVVYWNRDGGYLSAGNFTATGKQVR
jgi:hypothetical protein